MPKNLYRKAGSRIWYLRVTVAGLELRESLRTADRALAEKRAGERLEQINRRSWGDERRKWKTAVGRWLVEKASELRPQTVRRYECSLAAVRGILEPLYLDEIDRKVLARIAGRPGVTNATRRRDLTAVSAILHAAEAWQWLEAVPIYDRSRLRERREPIVLPTEAELAIFRAALSPMLRRLVDLLRQTGMRLEEAGSLEWSQVDRRRRVIQLTRTKARRPRAVPLSEEALGTILGTPRHLACPYVFWHSQDDPRRYNDLSGYLYDIRRRAGVRWRVHDLRHLFAVRYLQGGGSIYALQKILGHASIATTEGYLDHLTPEEQARAKGVA